MRRQWLAATALDPLYYLPKIDCMVDKESKSSGVDDIASDHFWQVEHLDEAQLWLHFHMAGVKLS